MRWGALLAAVAAAGGVLLPCVAPISAQPTRKAAGEARRAAEADRSAADAASREAREAAEAEETLAEGRVQAARRVQEAEAEALAAARRMRDAVGAAAVAEAEWRARSTALAPALSTMLRLGLWPAESLLASPGSAEDAARGLLVLQGVSRGLAAEAAALRAAARAAREGAVAAEAEARQVARAEAAARAAGAALDAALREAGRRRAEARDAEAAAAARAANAAARASDLEGALARLEREARQEAGRRAQRGRATAPSPSAGPAGAAHGGRVLPVAGQVSREFGAAGEGGRARGLTFQAAPGARVVSPCGGQVAFAAPFRSYGRLLIVDCGEGYHFVLGGLDRLDVTPGQRVLAGEPVGLLGGAASGAGTTDGVGRAALYVELRRHGDPVDPRPWFAARG